ncbi:hypothetical protein BGX38DRAFT_1334659 [Terfezia claveryi]|nr:hypothetical protein BGX38DRAFT_1334659 [Terfezia claveryi]
MPRKTSSQQATSQQATAPTGQASRKRKVSQIVATVIQPQPTVETAAAFTNNITFDNEDGRSDSESEVETFVDTAVLAPGIGRGTRSFSAIPDILQPFHAWDKAQTGPHQIERVRAVDTFLKSIHSRTRAHLIYECRASITRVYGISQLPKECMKTKVEYLLEGDRFICRQSSRDEFRGRFRAEEIVNIIYQRYFQGPKMKGNRDPGFLDRINGVFICFVASAMRHSLKAWKTGDFNPVMQEFKYETAWCTYERLMNTWEIHPKAIKDLMVNNIKADLARRIAAQVRMVEVEPVDAPQVEDEARYEAELRKELEHSYERLEVPAEKRRREGSLLRDSSVELAGPLNPEVDDALTGTGDIDEEDTESD